MVACDGGQQSSVWLAPVVMGMMASSRGVMMTMMVGDGGERPWHCESGTTKAKWCSLNGQYVRCVHACEQGSHAPVFLAQRHKLLAERRRREHDSVRHRSAVRVVDVRDGRKRDDKPTLVNASTRPREIRVPVQQSHRRASQQRDGQQQLKRVRVMSNNS